MFRSAGVHRQRVRRTALTALVALGLVAASVVAVPASASAAPTARVMVQTQRMADATLNTTQLGWYSKGSVLQLSCFKRGQNVKGYFSPWIPGGWDNLWYKTSDGGFVADVDIDTGSNNPVTGECGAGGPAAVSMDTNAWYTLTARNSNKALDVRGGSNANGTAVQQYPGNGSNAQKWRFVPTDNGYYRLVSALNGGPVLDVSGAGGGNGTRVQIWSWAAGSNQQWIPVDGGNGSITLKPRHVGRCLDVPGGSSASSVQLQIWDCNGTTSQKFSAVKVGTVTSAPDTSGIANLANANVGKGRCDVNSLGERGYYNSCNVAWCAEFARWVWAKSGFRTQGLSAASGSFVGAAGQAGATVHSDSGYAPRVGDAVVFNYKGGTVADHVGLVTAVNGDGSITTVHGNLPNVVRVTFKAGQNRVGNVVGGMTVGNGAAAKISAYVTPSR